MSYPATIKSDQTTLNLSSFSHQWSDLNHDLLDLIFSKLNTTDLIMGVSSVCSLWRSAARNPNYWRVLDLSDWDSVTAKLFILVTFKEVFNRVLGFLREYEFVEEVYFPPSATGQDLIFVAERLPNLLYFRFANSNLHQDDVSTAVDKFQSLKGIAIPASPISASVFFCLTSKFADLSELNILRKKKFVQKYLDKSYIFTICTFFPKLRKLEIHGMEVTTSAILLILDRLKHLEYLDVLAHDEFENSEEIIKRASRLKVFIWHTNPDLDL